MSAGSGSTTRAGSAALDAQADIRVSWNGAALDRLLDQRHAGLVELTARRLRARGWTVVAEVSFSHFGDRGSIDLLAWHVQTRSLLLVEVKTELGALEATMRQLDINTSRGTDRQGALRMDRRKCVPHHRLPRGPHRPAAYRCASGQVRSAAPGLGGT